MILAKSKFNARSLSGLMEHAVGKNASASLKIISSRPVNASSAEVSEPDIRAR